MQPILLPTIENSSQSDPFFASRQMGKAFSQPLIVPAINANVEENARKNCARSPLTISNLDMLCKNYMEGRCDAVGCRFYHPTPVELIVYSKTIQNHFLKNFGKSDGDCEGLSKFLEQYVNQTWDKFNKGEDECGQQIKKIEVLQDKIVKKPLKLSETKQQ